MAKFKHLTWDDLDSLTRDELIPRLDAEQAEWARKERRGLSAEERQARQQFTDIVFAVLNPGKVAASMRDTTAWLNGERATNTTFWSEKPGRDQQ